MTEHFFMKHWLSILMTVCVVLHSVAQSPLDSLASVLEHTRSDTQRLSTLNLLSQETRRKSTDLSASRSYAEQALELANRLGDDPNRARALLNLGNVDLKEGNYAKVLGDTLTNLPFMLSTGDAKVIANYYTLMANCHNKQGDLSKALTKFLISLKKFESIGDSIGIGSCYNNIGIINANRGNNEEALKWFSLDLELVQRMGDPRRSISVLGNIGNIYANLNDYEKALEYQGRSLQISKEHDALEGQASAFNNIGVLRYFMKQYDKAVENHSMALKLNEKLGRKQHIAGNNINLAGDYTMLRKFREAESHLQTGLELAKQIGHMEYTRNAYEKLATLDSARGNHAAALEHYKIYKLYSDSIVNDASSRQLNEMQTKYDTEKKDHEIVLLNMDNELQKYQVGLQKRKMELFCQNEMERFSSGWIVESCEESFKREFHGMVLEGRVDRIDKRAGQYFVLDYKNGSYALYNEKNFLSATDFQLEFYYLLAQNLGEVEGCAYYDLQESKVVNELFLKEKIEILKTIIEDLLKIESLNFSKCEDINNCYYCEYSIVCNRIN